LAVNPPKELDGTVVMVNGFVSRAIEAAPSEWVGDEDAAGEIGEAEIS
jgi:hypothetical protein